MSLGVLIDTSTGQPPVAPDEVAGRNAWQALISALDRAVAQISTYQQLKDRGIDISFLEGRVASIGSIVTSLLKFIAGLIARYVGLQSIIDSIAGAQTASGLGVVQQGAWKEFNADITQVGFLDLPKIWLGTKWVLEKILPWVAGVLIAEHAIDTIDGSKARLEAQTKMLEQCLTAFENAKDDAEREVVGKACADAKPPETSSGFTYMLLGGAAVIGALLYFGRRSEASVVVVPQAAAATPALGYVGGRQHPFSAKQLRWARAAEARGELPRGTARSWAHSARKRGFGMIRSR